MKSNTFLCARYAWFDAFHAVRGLAIAVVFGAIAAAPGYAQLLPGDVIALQEGFGSQNSAVVRVNPSSGTRTVISQFGVRGTGPEITSVIGGIDVGPNGDIYLSSMRTTEDANIFRINPLTGDRTIISNPTIGTGPQLRGEGDLVVDSNGFIFATSSLTNSIIQVDPTNGNRVLISGPGRGTGPVFVHPGGLTITPEGDFYTFATNGNPEDLVYFVDAETGNRTVVSGGNIGSGPTTVSGFDVTRLPDGDLAVVDHRERILRVDDQTGARSVLADSQIGSGPVMGTQLEWVTVDSSGFLLATSLEAIYRVNPANGNRTLLGLYNDGSLPPMNGFREAVEFMPVPEPSTFALAAAALSAFAFSRRVRRQ